MTRYTAIPSYTQLYGIHPWVPEWRSYTAIHSLTVYSPYAVPVAAREYSWQEYKMRQVYGRPSMQIYACNASKNHETLTCRLTVNKYHCYV